MTDTQSVNNIIEKTKPDEIYNLAAQSHVAVSFEIPEYTSNADAQGTLRILEAIKNSKKKLSFIKLGPQNYLEKLGKYLKQKIHHFILRVLMELLNFMLIGLLLTTESLIIFLLVTEFYLITRVL